MADAGLFTMAVGLVAACVGAVIKAGTYANLPDYHSNRLLYGWLFAASGVLLLAGFIMVNAGNPA